MNENEKLDRDKMVNELVDTLISWSDEILSYDPDLVRLERPDLMYSEDGMWLWKTNTVRALPQFEMYQIKTIISRRHEQQRFNPYMGQLNLRDVENKTDGPLTPDVSESGGDNETSTNIV